MDPLEVWQINERQHLEWKSVSTYATSIKLDTGTKTRTQQIADARLRSSHWLMREGVKQHVEREEAREQLPQDALAAWHDYESTGRQVAAEEGDAWLARLEAEDYVPLPECQD